MLQTPFSKHTCLLLHQLWVAYLWVVCLCEIFNVFIFYCQDEIIENAFLQIHFRVIIFKWNIFTYIILLKSKIYTLCVFIWLLLFASFICRRVSTKSIQVNKFPKQADDSSFIPFRVGKWFIGYSCASRRTRVRSIQPLWLLCRLECCLTYDFSFKGWRQRIPEASWLTQVATLANSGFDHETTSQRVRWKANQGTFQTSTLDFHMHVHTCAHTHVNVNTHTNTWKRGESTVVSKLGDLKVLFNKTCLNSSYGSQCCHSQNKNRCICWSCDIGILPNEG